ncbi:MAG: alpha/beta hydrolase [Methylacidiphilales bacterium]|nr:alpha/beta hydrolase [Candidatus Methylacidiphilales bacterium]
MISSGIRSRLVVLFAFALPELLPAQTLVPGTNAAPSEPPPPPRVVLLHDVVIGKGGDQDIHAEVAYPANITKPVPGILCFHGGGWLYGKSKDYIPLITALAHNGYFAASIDYRLSNVAKWPAEIQDCKLAVRWLRANAAQYHVDPNRIVAWGGSAGGHLAACLGTMADVKEYEGDGGYPGVSSAVQAVVDFYGPVDLSNPGDYSSSDYDMPKLIQSLFGVPFATNPDLWKSGSPLLYVKAGDPPMIIVHGDSDKAVPLAQSVAFDAALTQAGVPHQFIIVKNADHGFKPVPGATIDPSQAEIYHDVSVFLAKYIKGS